MPREEPPVPTSENDSNRANMAFARAVGNSMTAPYSAASPKFITIIGELKYYVSLMSLPCHVGLAAA